MGSTLQVLANGAVYDKGAKRIVKGATLSHDQASAMAKARWDKAAQVDGQISIAYLAKVGITEDPARARFLIEAALGIAANPGNRQAMKAVEFLWETTVAPYFLAPTPEDQGGNRTLNLVLGDMKPADKLELAQRLVQAFSAQAEEEVPHD